MGFSRQGPSIRRTGRLAKRGVFQKREKGLGSIRPRAQSDPPARGRGWVSSPVQVRKPVKKKEGALHGGTD